MGPQAAGESATIGRVIEEFLREREPELSVEDFRLYRHVLFFLRLCIDNYGHRNLDPVERDRYEKLYHREESAHFFEVYGPRMLLPELDFFLSRFLQKDVHTSDRVIRRSEEVIAELKRFLLRGGYLSPESLAAGELDAQRRARLSLRLRRLRKCLTRRIVSADPTGLTEADRVPLDAHLVARVEPGRVWLRVYRNPAPEEIGPLLVPEQVTKVLRVGWNLACALGRMRGRWQLLEMEEIHPRG